MAESSSLFSGLLGGVIGAIAVSEHQGRPGTDWHPFTSKVGDSIREFDGFVQQATFVLGKAALGARTALEQLAQSFHDGTRPSGNILDKADFDASLDASKQGADFFIRGSKLIIEALIEGAKVTATRVLISTEHTKEVVLRQLPATQEKIGEIGRNFLSGYRGGRSISGGGGYGGGGYGGGSGGYGASSGGYGAPSGGPSGGGFFW